jgi:hypothetical protein
LISFDKYIIIQSVGAGDEMNLQINLIKKLVNDNSVKWSGHVLKRMLQRQIATDDVINCIMSGEIIESYPDDYPFPSCLIFGYTINNKILHVVVGNDNKVAYIITAYYPDNVKFSDDLKTRRL